MHFQSNDGICINRSGPRWLDIGRTISEIDRFFPSSKRCHGCGFVDESMPLDIREWDCPDCGCTNDHDINAAQNIKTVGLVGLT